MLGWLRRLCVGLVAEAMWWVVIRSIIMPLRGPTCKFARFQAGLKFPSWTRVWQYTQNNITEIYLKYARVTPEICIQVENSSLLQFNSARCVLKII